MPRPRQQVKAAPLLGAHVVVQVVAARRGIPARALAGMGVDLDALGDAARAEIAARPVGR